MNIQPVSALVAARRDRLPENFLSGRIYVSDQTHHSLEKAALLAGFPAANVREIPSDPAFRIRVDALARAIGEDRAAGWTPFLVAGNAGVSYQLKNGILLDIAPGAEFAFDPTLHMRLKPGEPAALVRPLRVSKGAVEVSIVRNVERSERVAKIVVNSSRGTPTACNNDSTEPSSAVRTSLRSASASQSEAAVTVPS